MLAAEVVVAVTAEGVDEVLAIERACYARHMSDQDILTTALALPAPERARLAHELIVSLDGAEDPSSAEAWIAEIGRRAREVEEGSAVLEEWSMVRERLAARRRARRSP